MGNEFYFFNPKDAEDKEIKKIEQSILLLQDLNNEYKNNISNIKVNNITEFYNSQFGKIGVGNLDYVVIKKIILEYEDYNIKSFIKWNIKNGDNYNLLILDGIVYEFDGENKERIKKSEKFKIEGMNIIYGDGKVVEQKIEKNEQFEKKRKDYGIDNTKKLGIEKIINEIRQFDEELADIFNLYISQNGNFNGLSKKIKGFILSEDFRDRLDTINTKIAPFFTKLSSKKGLIEVLI